jgi:hypothetical protein
MIARECVMSETAAPVFMLVVGLLVGVILGIVIAGKQTDAYYIRRLKAAGLAYHDHVSGELIINLPEGDAE